MSVIIENHEDLLCDIYQAESAQRWFEQKFGARFTKTAGGATSRQLKTISFGNDTSQVFEPEVKE